MLNKAILIGRLTRDPELRYTQNGTPVAKFTLAVDRPFANQEGKRKADFIDVVIWSKQAEVVTNNLTKGRLVAVEGRIQVRTYEAKGQKHKAFEVVADRVWFLDSRGKKERPADDVSPGAVEVEYNPEDVPF